jgi:hypothetical protein
MAGQTVKYNNDGTGTITVHGRSSLNFPFDYWDTIDGVEVQIDISGRPLVFEVDTASLSVPLVPNPDDPKGLMVRLTRTQVAALKTKASPFAIIDETASATDEFDVLWDGLITRVGYIGEPDQVEG